MRQVTLGGTDPQGKTFGGRDPGFFSRIGNALKDPRLSNALLGFGGAMTQASAPSAQYGGFGQALAQGLQGGVAGLQYGQQMMQQQEQDARLQGAAEGIFEKLPPELARIYRAMGPTGVQKAVEYVNSQKPASPIALGADQRLVDPTTRETLVDAAPAQTEYDAATRSALQFLGYDPATTNLAALAPQERAQVQETAQEYRRSDSDSVTVNTGDRAFDQGLANMSLGQFEELRTRAVDATNAIMALDEAGALAAIEGEGGIITGFAAPAKTAVAKALGLAPEAVANTETFQAAINSIVLPKVKALGSGQAISNSDREFVLKIVGGQQTLDAASIRRIIEINRAVEEYHINQYNRRLQDFLRLAPDNPFMQFQEEITVPQAGSGGSSASDPLGIRGQ